MLITLCGSARFEDLFHKINEELSLAGHVVYALSVYPSLKAGDKDWYTEEQKAILDKVHLEKIRHSDAIVVINPEDYKGKSTLNEIAYANSIGRRIYYYCGGPHYSGLLEKKHEPKAS